MIRRERDGIVRYVHMATGNYNAVTAHLYREEHVILLGCGERTLRFRPAMTVTADELDEALDALDRAVTALT